MTEFPDLHAAVDDSVTNDTVGADAGPALDDAGTVDLAGAIDLGTGFDLGERTDTDTGDAVHDYAGGQKFFAASLLKEFFGRGEFHRIVHAEQGAAVTAGTFGLDAAHVHTGFEAEGNEIGDVVFAAFVIVVQSGQKLTHGGQRE